MSCFDQDTGGCCRKETVGGEACDARGVGLLPVRESLGLRLLAAKAKSNRVLGERAGKEARRITQHHFTPLLSVIICPKLLSKR